MYKVETIGDAYMVVSGAPQLLKASEQAEKILEMAQDMLREVQKITTRDGRSVQIRIGIHTGPVYAGVVGVKMPRYWYGD